MNDQIQKLMGKTLDDEFSHTWDTMTYEELLLFSEKFAELIVRECGQVLVDNTPAVQLHGNCYNQGYDRAMNDCIHYIYEHFGLEE
jgi:hypothetical protein